jgi:hypothetical protein
VAIEKARTQQQDQAGERAVDERFDLRADLGDGGCIAGQFIVCVRNRVAMHPSENLRRLRIDGHNAVTGGEVQREGLQARGDVVG